MVTTAVVPRKSGTIIEVVGIDGSGKSTVVAALVAELHGTLRKVSPFSATIHATAARIESSIGEEPALAFRACAIAEALIGEAADAKQGPQIFDRYIEAAKMFFSVQGTRPLSDSVLDALPQPDLVVLLEIDVELAMTRRLRPSHASPSAEQSYLRSCADYFRRKAQSSPWSVVDASQSLDVVVGLAAAHARSVAADASVS
jgi:dTMP kinase